MADPARDISVKTPPAQPESASYGLAAAIGRVAGADGPTAIADALLDGCRRITAAGVGAVVLWDPTVGQVVCRASAGAVALTGLAVTMDSSAVSAWLEDGLAPWLRAKGMPQDGCTTLPLFHRDRQLGAVVLSQMADGAPISAADQSAMEAIAAAASLALANGHLATSNAEFESQNRDIELAAEIQRNLLPGPEQGGPTMIGLNRPAKKVSGDFFDFYPLPDGRIRFALGDVSGKGLNAALLMAKTASLFHCLGKALDDPAHLLALINRELRETGGRGMFVTMVAGVYSPASGEVRFANAGHLPPLLRRTDRSYEEFPADAPPLGVLSDLDCETQVAQLDGGEFYIFTDGLTEFQYGDSDELGVDGLIQMIESMAETRLEDRLRHVLADLDGDGWRARDDLTVLAIDDARASRAGAFPICGDGVRNLMGPSPVEAGVECLAYLRLPAQVDRMRLVRGAVAGAAGLCGFDDDTTADIVLAVAEAGQNVILHAYGGREGEAIELEILRRANALVIRLRDFASPTDPDSLRPRDLDDIMPGGLGTHFIREIMDSAEFLPPPGGEGNLLQLTKKIGQSDEL